MTYAKEKTVINTEINIYKEYLLIIINDSLVKTELEMVEISHKKGREKYFEYFVDKYGEFHPKNISVP